MNLHRAVLMAAALGTAAISVLYVAAPVAAREPSSPSANYERKNEVKSVRNERKTSKAFQEIDRRVAAFKGLTDRVNGMTVLAGDKKAALAGRIHNEVTSLTDLKRKIESDDGAAFEADKKKITDSYRDFALFLPQVEIVAYADKVIDIANKMGDLTKKLETRFSEQDDGRDETATKLTELNEDIETAKRLAQNATDMTMSLTPAKYPVNKTELKKAQKLLKDARKALDEGRRGINDLKNRVN